MIERDPAADWSRLRPLDRDLLGLEPHPDDPGALSLVVVPHLCRIDARFYGGAALAAALAASEAATGRAALWSTTQLVATAAVGERIRIDTEIVASGRTIDQVQVRGTVGDRLVFNAVGAVATPRPDGLHGTGQVMPRVPPPDECDRWEIGQSGVDGQAMGHHLVCEHRQAELIDPTPSRPGQIAVWARLAGDLAPSPAQLTPAVIGFLADLVPLAVARAAGVAGAGTSLDNTVRVGETVDCEWVLLDVDADVAVGGYGHGHVRIWSPDGRMVGTGTQSARMFTFEEFAERLNR